MKKYKHTFLYLICFLISIVLRVAHIFHFLYQIRHVLMIHKDISLMQNTGYHWEKDINPGWQYALNSDFATKKYRNFYINVARTLQQSPLRTQQVLFLLKQLPMLKRRIANSVCLVLASFFPFMSRNCTLESIPVRWYEQIYRCRFNYPHHIRP